MGTVGVWSDDSALLDRLEAAAGGEAVLLGGRHPADFAGTPLSLLIITPTATGLAGAGVILSRMALIPGENLALARRVRAQSAVSYGLGNQNTLTLSSLSDHRLSVALQRQIYTLAGTLVDPQEWVVPFDGTKEAPDGCLCRAGAMLLMGQPLGQLTP